MAAKPEAYVDTSALIAFADRSDTHYPLFRRAFSNPPALISTPLVVAEGQGWFLKRFDSYRALQFLAMVESMPIKLIAVGKKEMTAGAAVLRRFSDQGLTLVDAVGLHLMTARRIRSCWSTDFHLSLTGASLLIHEA